MKPIETARLIIECREKGLTIDAFMGETVYIGKETEENRAYADKLRVHQSDILTLHRLYTQFIALWKSKLDPKLLQKVGRELGIKVTLERYRIGNPFQPGFGQLIKPGEPIEYPVTKAAPKEAAPKTAKQKDGSPQSAFSDTAPATATRKPRSKAVSENQINLF